jgi:hypothetical protein
MGLSSAARNMWLDRYETVSTEEGVADASGNEQAWDVVG